MLFRSVGSRPHPDGSTGVLAGVLTGASLLPAESLLRAAAAGITVALAAGWLATWPVLLNRRWNARWTRWVMAAGEDVERFRRAGRAQALAWVTTAVLAGVMVLAAAAAGIRLAPRLLGLIPSAGGGGGAIAALLWGLGLGSGATAFQIGRAHV